MSDDPPIACNLIDRKQIEHRQEVIAELFKDSRQVTELADGYALSYPGSAQWATKLLEFIVVERSCCPFFTFELVFEPNQGPILLRLRGAEGVKELMEEQLNILHSESSL